MKISELVDQIGVSEKVIRQCAADIGETIPNNKSVINKALAEKVTQKLTRLDKPTEEIVEQQEDVAQKPSSHDTSTSDLPIFKVAPVLTVKEFAEIIEQPVNTVLMQLINDGFMVNINENIDFDVMSLLADDLGIHLEIDEAAAELESIVAVDLEALLEEDQKTGNVRSPVVSVMGHVDHGKTSLLDTIRKSDVVAGEAGSITQSIGAYQVHTHGRDITFIDTPGHEAFIAMRKRGVQATDIAILVVAANEGVKSQTKEAISHAQEANIPIIVAITKIDLEDANPEKIKTELTEIGLVPEEWGGDVMMVGVSKYQADTIQSLLDMVLLQADMMELKADKKRPAIGTVIESNLDSQLGKIATVLIHTGTLNVRDVFVIGSTYGRVRTLLDDHRASIETAGPSAPILITGLNDVPHVGDVLQVVNSEKEAKRLAEKVAAKRGPQHRQANDIGLDFATTTEEYVKGIRIILKADTIGSLEAIKDSLSKIKTENAHIKLIRGRTGNIAQSDVLLAAATQSLLVAFNVDYASSDVETEVTARNIEVLHYKIIYKLVEELTARMLESIEPEFEDIDLGIIKIKKIFFTEKGQMIVGGKVRDADIESNVKAKVYRNDAQVSTGEIIDIQKGTNKVDRVEPGNDCGVTFKGKFKLKEGDELHFYKTVEKKIELK